MIRIGQNRLEHPRSKEVQRSLPRHVRSMIRGQAAAIVGLAPHAQNSGTLQGHWRISGGRRQVRAD